MKHPLLHDYRHNGMSHLKYTVIKNKKAHISVNL